MAAERGRKSGKAEKQKTYSIDWNDSLSNFCVSAFLRFCVSAFRSANEKTGPSWDRPALFSCVRQEVF
jgi:hypothetical protein